MVFFKLGFSSFSLTSWYPTYPRWLKPHVGPICIFFEGFRLLLSSKLPFLYDYSLQSLLIGSHRPELLSVCSEPLIEVLEEEKELVLEPFAGRQKESLPA